MTKAISKKPCFPFSIPLSAAAKHTLYLEPFLSDFEHKNYPRIIIYRNIAAAINKNRENDTVSAATLMIYSSLLDIYRYLIDQLAAEVQPEPLISALQKSGLSPDSGTIQSTCQIFNRLFPCAEPPPNAHQLVRELLLLHAFAENPAADEFKILQDDQELAETSAYHLIVTKTEEQLLKSPVLPGFNLTIPQLLREPIKASPRSLAGQQEYILKKWHTFLPEKLIEKILISFDILAEEQLARSAGGPGPSQVLSFDSSEFTTTYPPLTAEHTAGYEQPEYEAFSYDADWMSNVVMIAKMTHVWLHQLSNKYSAPVHRLDQIPDAELDMLASQGFTGLWLIGLWERSPASQRIKELCGNPEAHASAYSLFDYTIAHDLGGEEAFYNLKERAWQRGIRLASDMVPNHTGIYSRWILEHPHWFIQSEHCPFPAYQFNGEDLSHDPAVTIQIEDGYWTKRDAAVVFRMIDRRDGRTRYIYHGNDGTSIPWNDTAQLDYLLAEVREAVIQTILHVARLTPIIRFDAAMTLAKKHYQRLWFPQLGLGGGIPSRAEHAMGRNQFDELFPVEFWREVVDRMAVEAPDTLLLAEAFWMMEGYFVRTLGMHRVYNSAFMNMLKQEENHKYRQTIRNVLEFNPEVLKRFVNFMNNPDEKTAVEQFGSQGKYFGVCVMLATMPGLPMFGHGQIEGFHEKYGMEYRRAYWDEAVDEGLLKGHELWIFPLLKRRWLFSGSAGFTFYDFITADGVVNENVFAYSNKVDNQYALVIYHNKYEHTAGWILDSTPFSIELDNGTRELRQTSLAVALDIDNKPENYLIFRDLSRNLEFIRSATDISQNGLFASLGEYQFHVFVDFIQQTDTADNKWSRLCKHLNGQGVSSLAEESIQLEHSALIKAFDQLLQALPAKDTKLSKSELAAAIKRFNEEKLAIISQNEVMLISQTLHLVADKAVCRKTARMIRNCKISKQQLPLSEPERRLTIAALLLQLLDTSPTANGLREQGLDKPLVRYISGNQQPDKELADWHVDLCCATAAACATWLLSYSEATDLNPLLAVLANEEVRNFIHLHEDKKTAWFNKERFEELLYRLTVQVAFKTTQNSGLPVPDTATIIELARASGYRLSVFIRLLEVSSVTCMQNTIVSR